MKRISFIFTFLAILDFYIAYSLKEKADAFGLDLTTIIVLFFFVIFIFQSIVVIFEWIIPNAKPQTKTGKKFFHFLIKFSYLIFGMTSSVLIYAILADILFIIATLIYLIVPFDIGLFQGLLFLFIISFALFGVFIGALNASRLKVKKVKIVLDKLPASFDGFKIVQISDLHVGSIINKKYVKKVVKITNNLEADLIALTGDFVDGNVSELGEDVAPLALLAAKYGCFFVTGNHEYYWNANAWIKEFQRLGFVILHNENKIIDNKIDKIAIAGVPDYYTLHGFGTEKMNPQKAAKNLPENMTKILLAHQPKSYKMAADAGFDLQLSGHTHGGQYFPFTYLIRFFQPFYKGLNRYKNMFIYVNTGTGYWGPPLRTGSSAEITLITLKSN